MTEEQEKSLTSIKDFLSGDGKHLLDERLARLQEAMQDPLRVSHKIGNQYSMKGANGLWKIAYYPIFEDGKTGKSYDEPRALVEQPIGSSGTDFREVPLRYLTLSIKT